MSAYYNECDPEKAEWIRQLIITGVVAPGEVDERSIVDVRPDDLRGFKQCHFFAGIAVWSYALRLAGWPDDREVWTGSCPCPSFSCAGKGEGFDDPRHLWPEWFRLIRECRPRTVFGEQVAAAIGHGWLDLVSGDMEAEVYAIAAAVLGAHSAGAPHIRQRLYFVAQRQNADVGRRTAGSFTDGARAVQVVTRQSSAQCGDAGECADTDGQRQHRRTGEKGYDAKQPGQFERYCDAILCPDSDGRESGNGNLQRSGEQRLLTEDRGTGEPSDTGSDRGTARLPEPQPWQEGQPGIALNASDRGSRGIRDYAREAGATRGFWADCDWWYGRDGKYRPIEPGILPLVNGATGRVLKLRGYGDAICPETAKEFIASYLEVLRGD